jgi:hypothetical protein
MGTRAPSFRGFDISYRGLMADSNHGVQALADYALPV